MSRTTVADINADASFSITERSRTVLLLVVEIARRTGRRPISAAPLAAVSSMSVSNIEQIVPSLLRRGILKSVRGPGGGYLLAKPPEAISVGEVFRAVEHKSSARGSTVVEAGEYPTDGPPLTRAFRNEIDKVLQLVLNNISIADVIAGEFEQHPFLTKYWRCCDTDIL